MQLELDFGMAREPGAGGGLRADALYFAVVPDEGAARLIVERGAAWAMRYGLSGRLYPPERLHVSLNPLGRHAGLPRRLVARARAAGACVAMPPFNAVFDRLVSFRHHERRPLVLVCGEGAGDFDDLRHRIGLGLRQAGLPSGLAADFTPHLTLLRDPRFVQDIALETPVAWRVREFVLVHSLLGQGRHEHLERWPLCDPPASAGPMRLTRGRPRLQQGATGRT